MPLSEPSAKISEFVGLNNRAEPRAMRPGELTVADNVDLDDRKKIRRRRGYSSALTLSNLTALWATPDEERLFAVAAGSLYEIRGEYAAVELAGGLSDEETYWDWDGERVFVSNTARDMVIHGETAYPLVVPRPMSGPSFVVVDGNLPAGRYLIAVLHEDIDGRQGGASPVVVVQLEDNQGLQIIPQAPVAGYETRYLATRANGTELRRAYEGPAFTDLGQLGAALEDAQYAGFDPVAGGPIAYHAGRLWKGLSQGASGLVAASHPYWTHLFEYGRNDFMVPGRITGLADVQRDHLLIGTSRGVWVNNLESGLTQLTDYGMPAGQAITRDRNGVVYFWTVRGICRALPFENLSEQVLAAAPGERAAVGVVEDAGFARLLTLTRDDGGTPDNSAR